MATFNHKNIEHFYEMHHINQKDTILFVHGHPFNHTQWQYQVNTFKNFKLILPDLRGYGKTIDNDSKKIYITEHAVELKLLLDALNIDKVHLVGLSMGGQIIMEFAKQFAERSKSLVICNALPFAETEESKMARITAGNKLLEFGMEHHVTIDIAKYIHPTTNNEKNEVYIHLKEMMISTNAKSAASNHFGRAEREDYSNFLTLYNKPIHFICGEADNFTPKEKMIAFANLVKPNCYSIVPKTGHLTNMENPIFFNDVLINFYKNNF